MPSDDGLHEKKSQPNNDAQRDDSGQKNEAIQRWLERVN